jgi:hypothetical protein
LSLSGCAQTTAYGGPPAGPPTLIIAPQSLTFAAPSRAAQSLSFEYGSENGSIITETDTCGSGNDRTVALGTFTKTSGGKATQSVTPESSGSCVLHYHNGSTTTSITVTVQ